MKNEDKLRKLIRNEIRSILKEGRAGSQYKFGNRNPIDPDKMGKGMSYMHIDGRPIEYTGLADLPGGDSFHDGYGFSRGGRGHFVLTHDEVLDQVTLMQR